MTEPLYAEEIVARYWPLHGPYSPERAESAADTVAELVRYLNYATGQGAPHALPYAAAAYRVLGALTAAVGGLDQTLRQLQQRTAELSTDPTLRHSDHREDQQAAITEAIAAGASLAAAQQAADTLRGHLAAAQSHLSPLYHREEPGDV